MNINYFVFTLVVIFAISSWIDINGLWVELPILVQNLPEKWNLPSYMSIIIQIANIGPLIFTISNYIWPQKVREIPVIYVIILVGAIACLLLAFFWDTVIDIGGAAHSVALLILQFFLALVDCTTSVAFYTYMALLKPQYMTALFIGESLSGLLPSLVALGQGAGQIYCVNQTTWTNVTLNSGVNETFDTIIQYTSIQKYHQPKFSIEIFFFFLFGMLLLSCLAFTLLNFLPYCKKEFLSETDKKSPSSIKLCTMKYFVLALLTIWINALTNGVLPSVQSYSCLPYGNTSYHLAVKLSSMAAPIACFGLFFVQIKSMVKLLILTMVGTGFAGYAMAMAVMSPSPLLINEPAGSPIIICVWILQAFVLTFTKVSVATLYRNDGRKALLWCGVFTQLGSAIGAFVMFILINQLHYFKAANPC
ncbi:hypothetical protein LOTGIDRAFT_172322 [Lottia gigantea]|uniref:Riboflavin transporter n=1 Tax=Lottia gigantea TaxID=225164 RepID=V4AWL4_LOTGI|nr:hypothetical protein LOTGIDRAFT_172322 [Lottia gigantea]ESP01858.1 hypothetical protein LOTGIDRAFT_172322 [Lottia gigantea]